MAYESPKFMLPIRLGTVNADGPQELFVYALTRKGRVETTNYRTVRLPTGMEVPGFVKEEFPVGAAVLFAASSPPSTPLTDSIFAHQPSGEIAR